MYLKRYFSAKIYEGQDDADLSLDSMIVDLSDDPQQKEVICAEHSSGAGQIAAGASYLLPKPQDYTDSDWMQIAIVSNGPLKLYIISPVHTAGYFLIYGSEAEPGIYLTTDRITSIQAFNTHTTDSIKYAFSLVKLPDISSEDSFRGLQSDGTQS